MVHLVKRPDGNIARELAVCQYCQAALTSGTSVKSLLPGPKVAEGAFVPVSKTVVPTHGGTGKQLIPTTGE